MDINRTLKTIIRELGLGAYKLEKYYPLIQEVLEEETLAVFSQYFPYDHMIDVNLKTARKEADPYATNVLWVYIHDEELQKRNLDIISVRDVSGTSGFSQWNAAPPPFNVEEIVLHSMASNIRSALNVSIRSHTFYPPNKLKLTGYMGYENVRVLCKIPYPTFKFIPESLYSQFIKLAKLDVKLLLYPDLKLVENMETADGSIDLKLNGWDNAEQDKEELLEKWLSQGIMHNTRRPFTYE